VAERVMLKWKLRKQDVKMRNGLKWSRDPGIAQSVQRWAMGWTALVLFPAREDELGGLPSLLSNGYRGRFTRG
jgi:hypothetical protein